MCTKFRDNPFSGSGDILMFICDRQTNRQTDRQMPHYHICMGETFYLIEKITSPTHYANNKHQKKNYAFVMYIINVKITF